MSNTIRYTAIFAALSLLTAAIGCGDLSDDGPTMTVDVTSDITSDTEWQSTTRYIVQDEIEVDADLVVEPGTIVEFEAGAHLDVESDGSLSADGTEEDPITFTGTEEQRGWWDGIRFFTSEHPNNQLNHVIVEYAGNGFPASVVIGDGNSIRDGGVEIQNSTIRHGENRGLYIYDGSELRNSADNEFYENDIPVRVAKRGMGQLDGNSTYAGNDNDYIQVLRGGVGADISSSMTLDALDVPYRVDTSDTVEIDGGEVEIEAGTVMEFEAGGSLQLTDDDSALTAEGTADDNIVFTGVEEQAGWWDGVWIQDSENPRNVLEHVVIEYGGGDSSHPGNLIVGDSNSIRNGSVSISDSILRHSAGYGIYLYGSAELTSENNEFSDNPDGDSND